MAISDYSEPVAHLLTQGECSDHAVQSWVDYQTLGISEDTIPSLIQMATDEDLYLLDSDVPEGWSPIHAWRTLGQLRAEAAVDPLLNQASKYLDHDGWWDWMALEFPRVFALIGESILPNLTAWMRDQTQDSWVRVIALEGIEALAKQDQSSDVQHSVRQRCIAIFLEELTQFGENEPEFNAFVIGALAKLKVMEAVPLMEQAFAAGKVDEMLFGNWDEIQVRLGLKSRDEVPRKPIDPRLRQYLEAMERMSSAPSGFGSRSYQPAKSKRKAKQKQQAESRRKNRKKK
jgi:hypothetical protein